jgi:hypothetical protein
MHTDNKSMSMQRRRQQTTMPASLHMVVCCIQKMISKETIQEFQQVIEEDYGKVITSEEAESVLKGAVRYFDLLAKIEHRSLTRFFSPLLNAHVTCCIFISPNFVEYPGLFQ